MTEQTKITKSAPTSYTEAIDAGNAHFPQRRILCNQPSFGQFVNNRESELMLPLKSFRYLSSRQRLIGEKKRDEFFSHPRSSIRVPSRNGSSALQVGFQDSC